MLDLNDNRGRSQAAECIRAIEAQAAQTLAGAQTRETARLEEQLGRYEREQRLRRENEWRSRIHNQARSHAQARYTCLNCGRDVTSQANADNRAAELAAVAVPHPSATVADILTFYSERIANESFLRTATERRSVVELARAIGYELNPGVAASALLAFTIEEAKGAPGYGAIARGTTVQSLPGPGEKAQTFETAAPASGEPGSDGFRTSWPPWHSLQAIASGSAAIVGWNTCFSATPSWQETHETGFGLPCGNSFTFARSAWQSTQEAPAAPWTEAASACFGGFFPLPDDSEWQARQSSSVGGLAEAVVARANAAKRTRRKTIPARSRARESDRTGSVTKTPGRGLFGPPGTSSMIQRHQKVLSLRPVLAARPPPSGQEPRGRALDRRSGV